MVRAWAMVATAGIALCGGPARAIDEPATPGAQPGVKELLLFLERMSGNKVLAGQQEAVDWFGNDNENEMDFLVETTGRRPALRGFDFMFYTHSAASRQGQRVGERAILWAREGGVVTICAHWFAGRHRLPTETAGHFYTADTTFDLDRALTPGTTEHTEFVTEMDVMAKELVRLRDAQVPVLWRPFHENSGGWFWWGAKGPETFKRAWRFMFDRYTQVHGLTNLAWCFNPTETAGRLEAWYPGDDVVDVISLDVYPPAGTHPVFAAEYQRFRDYRGGRKVVTMSENGPIPDPDVMAAQGAGWPSFCTWDRQFVTDAQWNSPDFLRRVYTHERVITLDEMPDAWDLPPRLVVLPQGASVIAGQRVALSVLAVAPSGSLITYQWRRDGVDVVGATSAEFLLPAAAIADAGSYTVAVSSLGGTVESSGVRLDVVAGEAPAPRVAPINLSARAHVRTGDDVLIAGFVIGGQGSKRLLIRGKTAWDTAGRPADAPAGLVDSWLGLYDATGALLLTNDDWFAAENAAAIEAADAQLSGPGSRLLRSGGDSALLVTLPRGLYSVILRGAAQSTGTGLIELYDADPASQARLINLSARARIGPSHDVLIAGFVLGAGAAQPLLLRGGGPALISIPGRLRDPGMSLHGADGGVLDRNDDWGTAPNLADLIATTTALGSTLYGAGSEDASLLVTLPAGLYSTILGGGDVTDIGVGIVEVFAP